MNEDLKKEIIKITQNILGYLGIKDSSTVTVDQNLVGDLTVSIVSGDKVGFFIGKNGQNIDAIEHLIKVLFFRKNNRDKTGPLSFSVDVNDYRKLRSSFIIKTAKEIADKVSQTRRSEALAPMSSYERKLIHTELASFKDIETESVGEEPRRRIIIKPTFEI